MKNIRLRSYKDTGAVLIDQGIVDHERLQDGLALQAESGFSLGRALVELGLISEWELARAVSRELGVAFIRLREVDVVSEACHQLDPVLLHQNTFLILDHFDGVDTVVVAEPPTLDLLTDLSPVLGDKVFFLVALISDVIAVLHKAVPIEETNDVSGSHRSRTAEEILRGFGDA